MLLPLRFLLMLLLLLRLVCTFQLTAAVHLLCSTRTHTAGQNGSSSHANASGSSPNVQSSTTGDRRVRSQDDYHYEYVSPDAVAHNGCANDSSAARSAHPSGSEVSRVRKRSLEERTLQATAEAEALTRCVSFEALGGVAKWDESHLEAIALTAERDAGFGFSVCALCTGAAAGGECGDREPAAQAVVVRSLVPRGVAHRDGRLKPGDRLLAINGQPLDRDAPLECALLQLRLADIPNGGGALPSRRSLQLLVAKPCRLQPSLVHSPFDGSF